MGQEFIASIISNNYGIFILILLFVVYLVLLKIIYLKAETLMKKIVSKSKTELDDLILKHVKKPLFYLLVFLGLYFELHFIGINEKYFYFIKNLLLTFIILFSYITLYKFVNIILEHWLKRTSKRDHTLLHFLVFLKSVIKFSILILAFFHVLIIWGVNITPLLASAGIAGLAIALAAQQLLGNFFGGINLFLDKAIKVGDRIRFNGKYLIVEEVNIRTTKFRTLENAFYIVPNSVLANSEIENLSQPEDEPKNVRINIGVAYGSDVDKVKEVLKRVAEENSYRLKDEPVDVYFYELGDYSLNFLVVFRVEDASKMWPAQVEYIEKVYKELEKEGIEIPFPTQTIYCKKE